MLEDYVRRRRGQVKEHVGPPHALVVRSHEAAIGPVAEDAVEYLMTRGLTRDEAVSVLTRGFLNLKLPGLPEVLAQRLQQVIAATAIDSM